MPANIEQGYGAPDIGDPVGTGDGYWWSTIRHVASGHSLSVDDPLGNKVTIQVKKDGFTAVYPNGQSDDFTDGKSLMLANDQRVLAVTGLGSRIQRNLRRIRDELRGPEYPMG